MYPKVNMDSEIIYAGCQDITLSFKFSHYSPERETNWDVLQKGRYIEEL